MYKKKLACNFLFSSLFSFSKYFKNLLFVFSAWCNRSFNCLFVVSCWFWPWDPYLVGHLADSRSTWFADTGQELLSQWGVCTSAVNIIWGAGRSIADPFRELTSSPSTPTYCVLNLRCTSTLWLAVSSLSLLLFHYWVSSVLQRKSKLSPSLLPLIHDFEMCKPLDTALRCDLEFLLPRNNPRRAKNRNISEKDCKKDGSNKPYLTRQKKSHRGCVSIYPSFLLSIYLFIYLSIYLSIYHLSIYIYHLSIIYQSSIFKLEFRGYKAIVWLFTIFIRNKAWAEVIFWKDPSLTWKT